MCILSLALEMKHRFPKSIFMHYFYFIVIKIRLHIYTHTHDSKEKKAGVTGREMGKQRTRGCKIFNYN
jgi:hypothetical protein